MKHLGAILIYVVLLITNLPLAEGNVPMGINYQAIVRDGTGNVVVSKTVDIRFTLVNASSNFVETQSITTNQFGLVNLVIGEVNTVDFENFIWSETSTTITIEVNDGSGYVTLGTNELQSVPYTLMSHVSDSLAGFDPNSVSLNDSDGDTYVEVDQGSVDDDVMRFFSEGTELMDISTSLGGVEMHGNLGVNVQESDTVDNDIKIRSTTDLGGITLKTNDNNSRQGFTYQKSGGNYSWFVGTHGKKYAFEYASAADFSLADTLVLFDENGMVGIGETTPVEALEVYTDQDESAIIGRTHIGYVGTSDWAGISHIDFATSSNYAFAQMSSGKVVVNAPATLDIDFRINNTTVTRISDAGKMTIGDSYDAVNELDVDGAVVIGGGAAYAGAVTAPNNGLVVQGSVAIGQTSANEKLDVSGSAEVTGEYKYSTAKTHYLTLLGNDFIGTTTENSQPYLISGAPLNFDFRIGLQFEGGTVGGATKSINLPDGATIIGLTAYFKDEDAGTVANTSLERMALSTQNAAKSILDVLFKVGTNAAFTNSNIQQEESTTLNAGSAVVDNSSYVYFLRFDCGISSANALYQVRVEYTVDQAD